MKQLSSTPLQGRLFALPAKIELGLKGLPEAKNSSLLHTFENYCGNKFYKIAPWVGIHKTSYLSVNVGMSKTQKLPNKG